jgi:DNA (cytosine-5)-methyltransferase 1
MLTETFRFENDHIVRKVTAGRHSGETRIRRCTELPESEQLSQVWWSSVIRGDRIIPNGGERLSVVDLFSGSGGLSLGVSEAILAVGMTPDFLIGADMDANALEVYARNFMPRSLLHANIGSLVDCHVYGRAEDSELAYPPELLHHCLAEIVGRVDLLVAGPPCQGHSNLNNHTRRDDPRNRLYISTVAIGIALKAKAILIENVPEVVKDSKDVVATAKKILKDSGYKISDTILNAAELGAGQSRRRHFLIATLNDHLHIDKALENLKKPPLDLKSTIGDLEFEEEDEGMLALPTLSVKNQDRINFLFDNGLYDLPNQVRPDCHKNGHTYRSVYGRLSWDKPSPTITTGFTTPGRGRHIHPSQRRVLMPREAARIQGFPDWFDFLGEGYGPARQLLHKWIGDAVPSPLGYSAALVALTGI